MKNNSKAKVRTAIVAIVSGIAMIFVAICRVISCLGGGAVCIIAMGNETEHRRNLENMEKRFSKELTEFNGLFTAEKATIRYSGGRCDYYFAYYGDLENFISDCVDFCNCDAVFEKKHVTESFYFTFNDYYFTYFMEDTMKPPYYVEVYTNVYLEDYSILETIPNIRECQLSTKNFTAEESAQIESTKDKYSFELKIS